MDYDHGCTVFKSLHAAQCNKDKWSGDSSTRHSLTRAKESGAPEITIVLRKVCYFRLAEEVRYRSEGGAALTHYTGAFHVFTNISHIL